MSYFSEQGEIEEVFNLLRMFSLTFHKAETLSSFITLFCSQASQSFSGATLRIDAAIGA